MFDIVVPSKETPEAYLTKCLDSIMSQTVTEWHCYIVSTTDVPLKIRQAYPADKFTWLRQDSSHRFAAGARNQGVVAGSNPYIAFLDADDYWYEHHLSTFLPYLAENQAFYHTAFDAGTSYHQEYIGGRYLDSQHVKPGTAGYFYRDTPVWPTTLVVPREHFHTVSGFDERLPVLEDTDLGLRLSLLPEAQPRYIDAITAYHLVHGDSLVHQPDDFYTTTAISDWNREYPSLVNQTRPDHISVEYWSWLQRMSGAKEQKGVERPADAEVANRRYMSAYAFFHASPLKESNPEWEHLMTTEEEEWAFLDDL